MFGHGTLCACRRRITMRSQRFGPAPLTRRTLLGSAASAAVGWNHMPNGPTSCEDNLAQAVWKTFPDTYDELLRCAKDLKKNNPPPVVLTLGHACLWSFGGKEVEEDDKTV